MPLKDSTKGGYLLTVRQHRAANSCRWTETFMYFSFLAITFNIKKMYAKMRKEGMDWLIKLFYAPLTLFSGI